MKSSLHNYKFLFFSLKRQLRQVDSITLTLQYNRLYPWSSHHTAHCVVKLSNKIFMRLLRLCRKVPLWILNLVQWVKVMENQLGGRNELDHKALQELWLADDCFPSTR